MNSLSANSRLGLLGAAVVVFGATVLAVAPAKGVLVVDHAVRDGLPLAAWLLAAWGIGSLATRSESEPALRHVASIAIGLGVLSLLTLGLGVIGALNPAAVVGLIVIGLAAAVLRIRTNRKTTIEWWHARPSPASWLILFAVVPIGVAAVGALILPGILWGADEPAGYDVVAYHLQMPREWFELGRVTTLPHNVFSFFPLNLEMHYLLAMQLRSIGGGGPFAGMFLAQLMHAAFIGLCVASLWAIARPMGPLAAGVGAAVTAFVPWMPMLGSVAYNEGGLMLYATLAIGLALRGRWMLAGACAGFAAGCKPTGAVAACVLVPIVAALVNGLGTIRPTPTAVRSDVNEPDANDDPSSHNDSTSIRPHSGRRVVVSLAWFVGVALLVLAPWLVRTAIASHGNPVFPIAMKTLGAGAFDVGQVDRFIAAHSPRPDQQSLGGRLHALWQQVGGDWHYGTIAGVVPIWLALIVPAAWLGRRERLAWACGLLIVGNVLVWLFATHLQGRFLTHAIPLVGLLVACAANGRSTAARAFAGVAIVASVVSFALTFPFKQLSDRAELIGLDDPAQLRSVLFPEDVAAAVYDTQRPLVLFGDAKAFWYAVPQSRLRYRSVFDVPSDRPFLDAWLGTNVPADAYVIVDAGELERFERTYRNLPPMPAAWRGRGVFVIQAKTLTGER